MTRALVTGATGFVGANLARRLVSDGHDVHLLVRPGHRRWRLAGLDAQVHEVDFADPRADSALQTVISAIRPQWVFHLAASGAYSWQRDIQRMIDTNLAGTVRLLDACRKVGFEVFVNTGSSSEYGEKDHAPAEDERVDPNSAYAVTKVAATHYCALIADRDGVRIPTLRLYSVYGPYEEPNRLLPQLIIHGRRGGYPPLADPDIARDYVHVDDVVAAYMQAAVAGSGIYNVGSGTQTTIRQMAALAGNAFGISAAPVFGTMANRSWDTNIWVSRIDKIGRELGWRPQFTVESGFAQMVDWLARYDDAGLDAYCAESNAP